MSVESKLFVTCGKDKLVEVVNSVVKHLNVWVRKELDSYWQTHTDAKDRLHFLWDEDYNAQAELFTNGVSIYAYDMTMLNICFGCGDETHRKLAVFPDYSEGYSDTCEGDKITFSLNCWGKYDEIMKIVTQAVAQFGDVYYDCNDSDDEGFVLLSKKGE